MFSLGRQRPAMTGRLANLRDARVSLSQRLILIQHSTAPTPSKTKPLHRSTYFNFDHPRFQIMYRGVPVLLQRYCAASAGLLRVLTVLRDYDSTSLQHKLQRMRCADVIFKLHISKALALPSHTVGLERALRCKCET